MSSDKARQLFEGMREPLDQARTRGGFLNIWSVTGIRRKELPNAAVLAWMIDPRGSHGHGSLCLSALLTMVAKKSAFDLSDGDLGSARVQAEERPLGSDRDRVDIVVETPRLLLFLEVKIDAMEGQAQLSRYVQSAAQLAAVRAVHDARLAKKTLTVFLSPRKPTETLPQVVHVTWSDLARALQAAARHSTGISRLLIDSFATHIRAFG